MNSLSSPAQFAQQTRPPRMSAHPTTAPPKKPPRLLRFSLRLLLATLTLLCLALALWTHRAREQRRIVERIRETGGSVEYDYQRREQLVGNPKKWKSISFVPDWLLDRLGEDYFHEVIEVSITDASLLAALPRFHRIDCLHINSHTLTDQEFVSVAKLRRLKGIDIYGDDKDPDTQISDRSLSILANLPALELINLHSSRVTAAGLAALSNSQSLEKLYVSSPDESMNDQAAEQFGERITHLTIRRSVAGGFGQIVAQWSGARPQGPRSP